MSPRKFRFATCARGRRASSLIARSISISISHARNIALVILYINKYHIPRGVRSESNESCSCFTLGARVESTHVQIISHSNILFFPTPFQLLLSKISRQRISESIFYFLFYVVSLYCTIYIYTYILFIYYIFCVKLYNVYTHTHISRYVYFVTLYVCVCVSPM